MSDAQGADPLVRVVVRRLGADAPEPVVFDALLRRYTSGMLEIVAAGGASLPPLARDESLLVGRPVAGDATYDQRVHVLGDGEGGAVRVAPDGERQRNQQREHVRVDTVPLDVELTLVVDEEDEPGEQDASADEPPPPPPPAAGTVRSANRRGPLMVRTSASAEAAEPDEADADDESIPRERTGTVRDVSAGGLRVFHDGVPYEPGQHVQVQLSLPGEGGPAMELAATAEVRWTGPAPYDRVAVGLKFLELPRAVERQLSQWVFRSQAKQVRDAKR